MTDSVLIISKVESFMVNAIRHKLESEGFMCAFGSTDSNNIMSVIDEKRVIILYVDESIFERQDLLIYLKDKCNDDDLKLIIIGTPSDFNVVSNYISDNYLACKLERPIDMQVLITKLKSLQGEAQEELDKKRILIVDDDATYLRTIRDWLKDKYKVYMANSGIQALTWLAKNNADLILLDYMMPIASGPEILEMIRSEESSKDIPVIFLTSKSDRESVKSVMRLRPEGYLLKTINMSYLRKSLDRFFNGENINEYI
ncbi:MAG: response regulator [Lachnospiraceae bacterium]|nr:response regulator [Lachnospiraceae bacterium]